MFSAKLKNPAFIKREKNVVLIFKQTKLKNTRFSAVIYDFLPMFINCFHSVDALVNWSHRSVLTVSMISNFRLVLPQTPFPAQYRPLKMIIRSQFCLICETGHTIIYIAFTKIYNFSNPLTLLYRNFFFNLHFSIKRN